MRSIATICLMVCLSTLCNAQAGREEDDFMISFVGDYANVNGFIGNLGGGINLEYMITRHVGLQTVVVGNQDYAYFNGVAVLAPLFIIGAKQKKGSVRDAIQLLQILFFLSVLENPAFHIPIGYKFELIPYLSLFRARYIWKGTDTRGNHGWFASGSIGCKAAYYISDKVFVNAYYEGTRLYAHTTPEGWQAGLSIGFLMK